MKTTNMITIKSIYILAAVVGLQFNTFFATAGFGESTISSREIILGVASAMLAPATPAEATFEDADGMITILVSASLLAPVIPVFADFSDGAPADINISNIAPVTPVEAEFEDDMHTGNVSSTKYLAPVTPAEADFEDQA
jgi:hypothetical protein